MAVKNEYDLEQDIMSCWHITDDLETVLSISESEDIDEIQNALIGLRTLYAAKFDKLFRTFEEVYFSSKKVDL